MITLEYTYFFYGEKKKKKIYVAVYRAMWCTFQPKLEKQNKNKKIYSEKVSYVSSKKYFSYNSWNGTF